MRNKISVIAGLVVSCFSTAAPANDAAALAEKSGCMTACHAVGKRLVGPSFKEVAAKYKGRADAPAMLTAKIQDGGAGVWGTMPMPPQKSKVSEADTRKLVNWVLAR